MKNARSRSTRQNPEGRSLDASTTGADRSKRRVAKVANPNRESKLLRIAMLVDTSTTWGRSIILGVKTYGLKHGRWEIFVEARGLDEQLRVPAGWRGNGVIARISGSAMARQLKALQFPVVNVSGIEVPEADFPQVVTDLQASGELAARHFLERGFRHFGYFSLTGLSYVAEHQKSFAAAVIRGGGNLNAFEVKPGVGAEPDWRLDLAELGRWLKSLPKPVAVLCWNASSAREIDLACHEAGLLIPEEVSILSQADDEVLCETAIVPISGISVAGERIGHQAAELLDGLIHGRPAPARRTQIAPLGIVTRQSTNTLAIQDPTLVKAMSFLRQNANRPIRVGELARHAGVSRRLLEHRFMEVLHRSPAEEVRRVHLERARQLLVQTDFPMPQVAELSGLGSQAYFSYLFRRSHDLSPMAYRNKYRVRTTGR